MEFHRDFNQSINQSNVLAEINSARVPNREFKPSLYKDSMNPDIETSIAQRLALRKLFYILKEQNYSDKRIFFLLYQNMFNDPHAKDNIMSIELIRLFELRLVNICQIIQFTRIAGRYDFPSQDERVVYNKKLVGLDETMMRPILNTDNKFSYNSKLITCKPDPEFPDDQYLSYRSVNEINKMEAILKEVPILSYVPPACLCSTAITYRCHHCQKVIHEFYPCHTCNICVFCNIECYLIALDMYHRWECYALQRHMFSTYLFMAMRLMMIGMQTDIFNQRLLAKTKWLKYHNNSSYDRVMACQRDYIQDPKKKNAEKARHIGNKVKAFSNYYKCVEKYYELKKLPVYWERMSHDIVNIILDVVRMLGYLAHSTDLFQHLMKCPWKPPDIDVNDLQMYAGGMLLRHYGEVLCNVIALPNVAMRPESLEELEDRCTFVIGTNLCRFQHSCEPNAICFLYNNEVIVRTCEYIEKNNVIFIHYFGIEDAFDSNIRKELLEKIYFKCGCTKCNSMDYENVLGLAAFKCPVNTCEMPLFGNGDSLELQCFTCDGYFPPNLFMAKEKQVKGILEKATKINEFLRAEKICNEIYKPYNPNFDNIYRNLLKLYVKNHDSKNVKMYFTKYMELSSLGLLNMTKSLAKYNYFFLQYVLDMCRSEKFFDNDIMNILIKALTDIKLVYMFYYNIGQVSFVSELISEINPLIQHEILKKGVNILRIQTASDCGKLKMVDKEPAKVKLL